MILEFILKLGKCRVINRGPGPLCMYYVLSVLLPDLFHGNFHPAHATPSQCPSLLREQQVCVRRFSLPFCVLECFYPHSSFAQVWTRRTDLFPVSSRPVAPPRALFEGRAQIVAQSPAKTTRKAWPVARQPVPGRASGRRSARSNC